MVNLRARTGLSVGRRWTYPKPDAAQLNAGKHSIALDLKDPADKATALALARRADVIIENNRPGVMPRLGLAYEDLSPDNLALVYCSISGFGQTGPGALNAANAPNI